LAIVVFFITSVRNMSPNFVQTISFVLARSCDANSSCVYSKEKHYSVANDKSGSEYVLKFRSGNDLLFWHALVPQTVIKFKENLLDMFS
jgi:hypothetical protein